MYHFSKLLSSVSLQTLLSPVDVTQSPVLLSSIVFLFTIVIEQLKLQQLKAAQIKESICSTSFYTGIYNILHMMDSSD